MATMDTLPPRIDASCATNVWSEISEMLKAFDKDFKRVIESITKLVWAAMVWLYDKVICPFAATGVNVLGYIVDKFLFGSPSLRKYFQPSLFPNDISENWRLWVKNNSGRDIYETAGKIPSDLLGVLGGGIGVFTLFNHTLMSYCYLTYNYCDIIVAALNGNISFKEDRRNIAVKIIFGILAAPFFIPSIIESNIISCVMYGLYHTCKSIRANFRYVSHLLGTCGSFGERSAFHDDRGLAAKVFFGILSAPAVFVLATISNTIDAIWTFRRHLLQSFGWNLRATFNLLGTYGSFEDHRGLGDKRHLAVKIIFGIFSAPLVLPFALFTNLLDASITVLKHFLYSYRRNLRVIFNGLGNHGVFESHRRYADGRHLAPVIIFGVLSAPFVLATAVCTNILDMVLTGLLHTTLSTINIVASTYNIILGENGIFEKRLFYFKNDSRAVALKITFGILSLPIVVPIIIFTNTLDLACTFSTNFFISFKKNLRASYNLLHNDGIFRDNSKFEDNRSTLTKVIYGILSFPFVFPVALITNAISFSFSFSKNFLQSYYHNLRYSFNRILGLCGMFGERRECSDTRGLLTKIVFGIISAPLVAITAVFTNVLDIGLTILYQTMISFFKNVRATFNILLGRDGIFIERRGLNDNRMLITKITFGILTFIPTALVSLATNILDLACTTFYHLFLSFGRNLRATFNIVLGDHGIFSDRRKLLDSRGLFTKILFGIATAPLVFVAATITNSIDLIGAIFKNWRKTIKPLSLVAGAATVVILAIPAFTLRKVGKGVCNVFVRPIVDAVKHRPFVPTRIVKGVLNTVTLGAFSAAKKVFETATGYSSRFGMPNNGNSEYDQIQYKFRHAIELAIKSKFPGVTDEYPHARPLMRTLFHMRHRIEDILKNIHNIFQEYVREIRKADPSLSSSSFGMMTFFSSTLYQTKRGEIEKELNNEQRQLWEKAEGYLMGI